MFGTQSIYFEIHKFWFNLVNIVLDCLIPEIIHVQLFITFSDSTYEAEFQHFLRGQEGLPLENVATKVEGLTQAQAGAMVQLSKLGPFRKLGQNIPGNADFKTWLQSVAAEHDVPELWNVDKPLSKSTILYLQGVKILFNPILSYFFDKILFCPIFWEMSYFILFFGHFAFNFGFL